MASSKPKGRARKARFAGIPHHIMDCPNYILIGGWESRLLLEIAKQYNGSNNGDMSAAWSQLKNKGWHSKGTVNKALKNLLRCGFIQLTRQGGKHCCNLYGLTWQAIDDCNGKLDVRATREPSNLWRYPPKE